MYLLRPFFFFMCAIFASCCLMERLIRKPKPAKTARVTRIIISWVLIMLSCLCFDEFSDNNLYYIFTRQSDQEIFPGYSGFLCNGRSVSSLKDPPVYLLVIMPGLQEYL